MALAELKCKSCGRTEYLFETEYRRFWDERVEGGPCPNDWEHQWQKMPPRVSVVLATTGLMLDDPQLDSLVTIYELDRQLNLEARDAIEMEIYQRARRNA